MNFTNQIPGVFESRPSEAHIYPWLRLIFLRPPGLITIHPQGAHHLTRLAAGNIALFLETFGQGHSLVLTGGFALWRPAISLLSPFTFQLSPFSFHLCATTYQPPTTNHKLSAYTLHFSAFTYELPPTSHQLRTTSYQLQSPRRRSLSGITFHLPNPKIDSIISP
jgi:hypothetical protein